MNIRKNLSASLLLVIVLSVIAALAGSAADDQKLKQSVKLIDEFKSPGLEAEISGVFPHPTDPDLYYALANLKPPYRHGQTPKLPEEYRGKLLTVNRAGEVLKAVEMAQDDFGGMAMAKGHLYVALTAGAEILKVDPDNGAIVDRFPLPSPAGGLGYDAERNALIAQLYVGHPHLAVVDLDSGQVRQNLWSDESAMGLAKVDGDYLCTWASGWDPGSFSELRVLSQDTGHVLSRIRLDLVHSSLAPATDEEGEPAFISLVTLDSQNGDTAIRKYAYSGTTR
ncbi:MAG TPA: hypothetical protein VLV83_09250 [Acidobacteriota bacterium]|nr:hypothetical protein [Acidobacteriota bacterium]